MQSTPLLTLTGRASGAVSGGRCVGYNDAQATVAGQVVKGVARSSAADTLNFPIDVKGTTEAESGAAVAVGDALMSDASGRVVLRTATNYIVGYALKAATAAGQYIEVLLV